MKTPASDSDFHGPPIRRIVSAWVGLFLLLFNVLGSSALEYRPPDMASEGLVEICTGAGRVIVDANGNTVPAPAQQHPHVCVFCLPMCGAAAIPYSDAATLTPPSRWALLSFGRILVAQRRPAPATGGIARAPPKFI